MHVVDISAPRVRRSYASVNQTLLDKANDKPVIYGFNKIEHKHLTIDEMI
jgi:50S ribosomal subunit-associated GTPase HflX